MKFLRWQWHYTLFMPLSIGVFIILITTDVFSGIIGYLLFGFSFILLLLLSTLNYLKYKALNWFILLGLVFSLIVLWIPNSELFKSKLLFQASTVGGSFGGWHLQLRENGKYELIANSIFGSDTYKGEYALQEDLMILMNKDEKTSFIPDTLVVYCSKIPIHFLEDRKPDFDYVYFKIKQNDLLPLDKDCP